jgi:hypothetical protein
VDESEGPALPRPEEGAEEGGIVHLQDPRVGQVELEGGDALVPGQAGHLGERRLPDLANGHVEAVVDGRLALGLPPPRLEGGEERLAGLRGREVDDRGRAAERGGTGARLEVVGRGDLSGSHIEVGVGVDPAGKDETARGVEHRVRGQAQALADEGDLPPVHVEVGLVAVRRRDDAPVTDQGGRHLGPSSPRIVHPPRRLPSTRGSTGWIIA